MPPCARFFAHAPGIHAGTHLRLEVLPLPSTWEADCPSVPWCAPVSPWCVLSSLVCPGGFPALVWVRGRLTSFAVLTSFGLLAR